MKLGRALVLAVIVAVPPAAPAAATPPDVATAQVAQAVRAGTLGQDHGVEDSCTGVVQGHQVDLGCLANVVTRDKTTAEPLTTPAPAGFAPADLARAYHLPDASVGERGMVTIVGIGAYPTLEADLTTYRSQFGLPACTTANGCLKITDYHGGPALKPVDGLGEIEEAYATETALDVDLASAACPMCRITMVQIPMDVGRLLNAVLLQLPGQLADDFGTAVSYAASLRSSAVSMSYGVPTGLQGDYLGTGAPAVALHHPGMAVVAASGDKGYLGGPQLWPQELPWVTSVGGTSLSGTDGSFVQKAWGSLFTPHGEQQQRWVGAGSGCALDLGPAVGQPAAIAANCSGHRAGSDVSAVADPLTGVAVYRSYAPNNGKAGWLVVGGTSAASPFVAGLYARAGNLSQVDGPNTLYRAPSGTIADVSSGSNAQHGAADCAQFKPVVCSAGPGWDGPTGLGVPVGLGAF
ncbi:hypothetical protein VSH64_01950 [Amycolatopsis rhabdoformis]|uniref:Peptidase S53 domain-containing protein n=1 Tax=Amycolatopsis rhabdoformis TaxID=1448059 RepID=A0ABZ1I9Q0_9PSEU|nr:hypothetical protein [Amycolatopsis rhabdoformis]WSE30898.1 hypothetical protein VSH64_01950 [Amycolatopsis rhabdoformis]